MMRWFGPHADPPFRCDDIERVPVPEGKPCASCGEPILGTEFGMFVDGLDRDAAGAYVHAELPFHDECHVRSLVGPVEHQKKPICDATCRDDPALTPREAAKAATDFFRSRSHV